MSERTKRLKANVVLKAHKVAARGLQREEEGKPFRSAVKLCLERARLLTESYKQREGQPTVIRRAEALAHILKNMSIYIQPDELIVGNFASKPECVAHYPELQWRWVEKAVNDGYRDILDDAGREELRRIHEYWQTRAVHGMERRLLPEEIKSCWQYKGVALWMYQWEMGTPNYEKVFQVGFDGLIKEAEEKLKEVDEAFIKMEISSREYLEKKGFLEAVIITLNAAIQWAERYAKLARHMAETEPEAGRKKELERIAAICERVPRYPPRTFQEALQCFFFIHLIVNFIELPQVGCGVRFDQVFHPFYQKDLAEQKLTREEAQELLECLWIKFEETGFLHPPIWSGAGGGGLAWQP
jgi:formate C-acetyltransferase